LPSGYGVDPPDTAKSPTAAERCAAVPVIEHQGQRMNLRRAILGVAVLVVTGTLTAAVLPVQADAPPALAKPSGPQGDSWASIAKLPDWQGIWELDWRSGGGLAAARPAPPKLTPEAQAKLDAYKKAQESGKDLQPEQANCLPPGMPGMMTQPYPIEFLYSPGKVAIAVEAYMQLRQVFTDGRAHPADPDPLFNGHSIGHWEGDTLVVDTVGFVPWSQISPGVGHSDQMHIVERIHRIGPDRIEIKQTITDPKVLAEPWTVSHFYKLGKDDLREYECEQNNHDSSDDEGRPGFKETK
jgi:hypothetical protein